MNRTPKNNRAQNLIERLRAIASTQTQLDVAQFQFINLDEVKAAYGARWPMHKAKIKDIASSFLSKRITKEDILIPGNDGFVIVFGSATGTEAEFHAADLAHGLNQFLLGELHDPLGPNVEATTNSVDVEALVESFGDLDLVEVVEPSGDLPTGRLAPAWRYQPVWDVKKEVLPHFYTVPVDSKTHRRLAGYQFEHDALPRSEYLELDIGSLETSETDLRRIIESGNMSMIGVNVHIHSLANAASRNDIIRALDRFDPATRRYRLLKISAIPPGFPRIYLHEIIALLRQRVPNLVAGLSIDENDLSSILDCRFSAIGYSLPRHVLGQHIQISQVDLLERIRGAARKTHQARAPFFVEGPIGPALASRLSAIGVDYITSDEIWPTIERPNGIVRWTADRLLASA